MDRFSNNMKVSDLVEANYRLLGVISRLGIEGSFGEKTVSEICIPHGLDPDTIILICEVYSHPDFKPSGDLLRRAHIGDVLRYLHQSHDYYLHTALIELAKDIERLIEPCQKPLQQVIRSFLDGYEKELENHFNFEENEVIPYVQNLMIGQHRQGFSIDTFEENHSNIEEKLSDLKSIIMKSLPHECDSNLRISVLQFIFMLEEDLHCHTYIEDNILVPMVRLLENPQAYSGRQHQNEEVEEDGKSELSEREKEILVSVAQGLINKEIADKHNISINTVITHRKNITRKTGIKTISGLTVYAILNNLIDINSIE